MTLCPPLSGAGHAVTLCPRRRRRLGMRHERHGACLSSRKWSSRHSPAGGEPAACSRCRSSTRRIFPEMVLGSSKNSRRRTRWYGARWFRAYRRTESRVPGGLVARREGDVRLRHGQPDRIRRRDDGGLGDRRMLDEHGLELERTDLVVAGLEHVVGAPDERDVAVAVHGGDVAGVVVAAGHRIGVARRVLVPGHQRQRPALAAGREVQADLPFAVGRPAGQRVDEHHRHPGQRSAHRRGLDRRARRVPDLGGGLGLPGPRRTGFRECPASPAVAGWRIVHAALDGRAYLVSGSRDRDGPGRPTSSGAWPGRGTRWGCTRGAAEDAGQVRAVVEPPAGGDLRDGARVLASSSACRRTPRTSR